jgi:hypothetical protein
VERVGQKDEKREEEIAAKGKLRDNEEWNIRFNMEWDKNKILRK